VPDFARVVGLPQRLSIPAIKVEAAVEPVGVDAMNAMEAPRDPFGVYQKGALDAVESVQRVFRLYEGTAQAMTRSAERLQTSADHTGQEIQATVTQLTGKMKSLYAPLA